MFIIIIIIRIDKKKKYVILFYINLIIIYDLRRVYNKLDKKKQFDASFCKIFSRECYKL